MNTEFQKFSWIALWCKHWWTYKVYICTNVCVVLYIKYLHKYGWLRSPPQTLLLNLVTSFHIGFTIICFHIWSAAVVTVSTWNVQAAPLLFLTLLKIGCNTNSFSFLVEFVRKYSGFFSLPLFLICFIFRMSFKLLRTDKALWPNSGALEIWAPDRRGGKVSSEERKWVIKEKRVG